MTSYSERIQQFQQIMDADAAFLPISSDLQYLTGVPRDVPNFGATIHPGAWLEGGWFAPNYQPVATLSRMSAELSGMADRVKGVELRILGDWDDPSKLVAQILQGFHLPAKPRIAVSDWTPGETIIHLQELLPDAQFVSATQRLRKLRTVKSEDEIDIMRRAGALTEKAFAEVLKHLKIGMLELDAIAEVDYQMKKLGSIGPSFTTSMYNSGPNYTFMPGGRERSWTRVMNAPMALLFDFGAVFEGYCYDYGRTVSFGEPTAEFKRIHKTIMDSQAAGIAMLKAGEATCEQADAAARKVVEDNGYGAFFRHRLGHAIGVDVHEPPFLTKGSTTVFQEGMLFTVEPSITREQDFGARIEDVVVARPGGGEKLTNGWQDLIVVE
ncbi:MAG TPA: Xaa-Pro peptidase family protein [Phototrophicaceae bacterium]|nr:Xaa-Pro peptidase family protein [Phototrophicaceae bacterium]